MAGVPGFDWAAIQDRLRPFVRARVACDADADDVLQDVYVRVARGAGALRDADRFVPWLYAIVRNVLVDRARAARREPGAPAVDAPAPEPDDARAALRELARCVEPFVARLPAPYGEAVAMVDLEGLTHKEAARRAGITEPGMKSRVQRGRAKLRAAFEACCRIEPGVADFAPRGGCGPDGSGGSDAFGGPGGSGGLRHGCRTLPS
jgi:RNA polymerase sigma-70 factor (ECF subfamily)